MIESALTIVAIGLAAILLLWVLLRLAARVVSVFFHAILALLALAAVIALLVLLPSSPVKFENGRFVLRAETH
jgi:hypothetical protein